jgi:hypothetical protein
MQSEREGDYPAPVIIKNIPIWNDNEIEQFIKGRVLAHQAASKLPDNQLPFCMADDQWRQPTKWAVMSFRAAKAVKLFKSPEDANAFIEGKTRANNTYYVEIRPGGPLRCTHFCDVRPFCNQFGIESKYEEKKHGLQTGN